MQENGRASALWPSMAFRFTSENRAPRPMRPEQSNILLPPASRAEFILTGPPEGVPARLLTSYVFRGASDDDRPVGPPANSPPALRVGQDDVDSARPLISIVAEPDAVETLPVPSAATSPAPPGLPLSAVRPVHKRKLYFSEKLIDPNDPKSSTQFFITEDGHSPVPFDPNNPEPTLTVHQGDVEDWTIENRSNQSHAFHVHQLRFFVVRGQEPVGKNLPCEILSTCQPGTV